MKDSFVAFQVKMYFQSVWWDHWPEMAIIGMHRQENQKWKNRGKFKLSAGVILIA